MVVSMSDKEFSRLNILLDVQARRLRVDDAMQLLGLKRRQIFRLLRGLRTSGAASLASKRRGRLSNNKLPSGVRDLTMSLVKAHYADFGPTLATEKLRDNHACLLLVAGFAISARSMTSRCNNSICGDIDRGGQNSNCFEGRNDEKPEMAADSNEAEFRAFPAICLTASEHRQPGPGAETAFA